MRCDKVQRQLAALLDDELTPEAASAIEDHLAVCATCSQAHDAMRSTLEMAKAWQMDGGDVLAAVQHQVLQDEMRAVLLEMKRLRGEVVTLRAEVAALKNQGNKRDAPTGRGSSVLRFPYATVRDITRPIV